MEQKIIELAERLIGNTSRYIKVEERKA